MEVWIHSSVPTLNTHSIHTVRPITQFTFFKQTPREVTVQVWGGQAHSGNMQGTESKHAPCSPDTGAGLIQSTQLERKCHPTLQRAEQGKGPAPPCSPGEEVCQVADLGTLLSQMTLGLTDGSGKLSGTP